MPRIWLLLVAWGALPSWSFAGPQLVSMPQKALDRLPAGSYLHTVAASDGHAVVRVTEDQLIALSDHNHRVEGQCGGFFVEESVGAALRSFAHVGEDIPARPARDYPIQDIPEVRRAFEHVEHARVLAVIEKLSSFHNRFYRSEHGVNSQAWVRDTWREITRERPDIMVGDVAHSGYPQPSVVLTMRGSRFPDQHVVIGGHADSISGWLRDAEMHAPGADDNATGVAVMTETLRALIAAGFQPERTLHLMAYAAEEVGLRGSHDIAQTFRRKGKDVIGVMQLDMSGFRGTDDTDIVFIVDHTDRHLDGFLQGLMPVYLPDLKWGTDTCGYACSDHASWTRAGFPASFPFEAKKRNMNRSIHTTRDTVERFKDEAQHTIPFVKLSMAFAWELTTGKAATETPAI